MNKDDVQPGTMLKFNKETGDLEPCSEKQRILIEALKNQLNQIPNFIKSIFIK